MAVIDVIGVFIAVFGVCAIGVFLTNAYYERLASRRRGYEQELAEQRDVLEAMARNRHPKSGNRSEDDETAVW
jgi:hypothetical protein